MSFDTVDELHSAEDQFHRQADAVRQVDDWLASASMLPMPQELREVVRAARLEGDTFCRCFCEANQCSCDDPDCDEHDDVSTCDLLAEGELCDCPRCRPERTVRCPKGPDSLDVVGCGREFTDRPDDEGWFDCPHCGLGFNPDHPHSAPQPSGAP